MGLEGKKAALHNLGCKVNAYETEAMQQMLEAAGCIIVPFEEAADIYVINTCSVTNIADRKSRQMLHRARSRNPEAVLVAAGCYVQTAIEKTQLPVEADIIIGNNRKGELVTQLEAFFKGAEEGSGVLSCWEAEGGGRIYEPLKISRTAERARAFIKVQDGCNQFCSYCIIPYARGRIRSRAAEDVISEVERLARSGIREIVLTGIHLSSYGRDTGSDLLSLIRLCDGVEGVERIRLGSLEPGIITEEFAHAIAQVPSICPHFHLSLQSGCDEVLRRMNRHYSTQEYAERCALLREVFSDPALTTDVIVGFPGETQEEFDRTVEFLKQIRFYETHIFRYSRREGTRAAAMSGQLPEAVKAERATVLAALNQENKTAYEAGWTRRSAQLLLEEEIRAGGKTYFAGHTREYIRAALPFSVDDNVTDEKCALPERNQILTGRLFPAPAGSELHDAMLFMD